MDFKEKVIKKIGPHVNKYRVGESDYLLVSFPKAGSTWLRFQLANLYNFKTNTCDEVDFQNVHDLIPDLDRLITGKDYGGLPHIYSTHHNYSSNFNNCILLLRNPADQLYSYYKYLIGEKQMKIELEEVIKSPKWGISKLVSHCNSFVKNADSLIIVTYEMMHQNPFKVLQRLINFINLDFTDGELRNAIVNSSFSSMRDAEDKKGTQHGNPDFKFTRSGKIGDGEANIPEPLMSYINDEIKKSAVLDFIYNN